MENTAKPSPPCARRSSFRRTTSGRQPRRPCPRVHNSGDQREAKRVLAGILVASPEGYVDPHGVAIVYVALGDREAAFKWLRRAYDEHSYWLSWLGVDPRWDPLRSDSRFREVEQRVGVGS